jgi:hypothetical protein
MATCVRSVWKPCPAAIAGWLGPSKWRDTGGRRYLFKDRATSICVWLEIQIMGKGKEKHDRFFKSQLDDLCVILCKLMRCDFYPHANSAGQGCWQEKQGSGKGSLFPRCQSLVHMGEPLLS